MSHHSPREVLFILILRVSCAVCCECVRDCVCVCVRVISRPRPSRPRAAAGAGDWQELAGWLTGRSWACIVAICVRWPGWQGGWAEIGQAELPRTQDRGWDDGGGACSVCSVRSVCPRGVQLTPPPPPSPALGYRASPKVSSCQAVRLVLGDASVPLLLGQDLDLVGGCWAPGRDFPRRTPL